MRASLALGEACAKRAGGIPCKLVRRSGCCA